MGDGSAWFAQEVLRSAFEGVELPVVVATRCPACQKGFPSVVNRNRHVRTVHERRRTAVCTYAGCGKRFDSSHRLRAHVRAKNINLRELFCPVPGCESDFNERSNMFRHIHNVHEKRTRYPKMRASVQ